MQFINTDSFAHTATVDRRRDVSGCVAVRRLGVDRVGLIALAGRGAAAVCRRRDIAGVSWPTSPARICSDASSTTAIRCEGEIIVQ